MASTSAGTPPPAPAPAIEPETDPALEGDNVPAPTAPAASTVPAQNSKLAPTQPINRNVKYDTSLHASSSNELGLAAVPPTVALTMPRSSPEEVHALTAIVTETADPTMQHAIESLSIQQLASYILVVQNKLQQMNIHPMPYRSFNGTTDGVASLRSYTKATNFNSDPTHSDSWSHSPVPGPHSAVQLAHSSRPKPFQSTAPVLSILQYDSMFSLVPFTRAWQIQV